MKVLQLIQRSQRRGAEIFACQLTIELRRRGAEVDVVTLFNDSDDLRELFPTIHFGSLTGNRRLRLMDYPAFKKLSDLIHSGGYQLVQANAGDTLKYASLSRLLFGWKAKLVFRNANMLSGFLRNGFHRRLTGWFLSRCDYAVSVSENCRLDLASLFPAFARRSSTITIGVYLATRLPVRDRMNADPIFVNVGSLVPEKNHQFLIELFAAYVAKSAAGQLWILGEGPLKSELISVTTKLNLERRVRFFGSQPDVAASLSKADVFLMPSRVEGIPAAILEAMSHQVPVIASAVGGIPEVIRNGENGFCIADFKIDLYLDRIGQVLSDNALATRLVSLAYDKVKDHYQVDHIAGKFLNKYNELIYRG